MEIKFDLGTLIAHVSSREVSNPDLLGYFKESEDWKWDWRVNSYRAPAWKLFSIKDKLLHQGFEFQENITQAFKMNSYNKQKIELRDYQYEAFQEWFLNRGRGVVVMPTGTGKTRLALYAINELRLCTLILVPTRVLLQQWYDELQDKIKTPIGIWGDGQQITRSITVSTYESALRHLVHRGSQFGFVIVDEAHHFLKGERIEIMEMLCAPYCLSLSATFEYEEKIGKSRKENCEKNFKENNGLYPKVKVTKVIEILGPIVFRLSLDVAKKSILSPYDHVQVKVNLSLEERKNYNKYFDYFSQVVTSIKNSSQWTFKEDLYQLLGQTPQGRLAIQSLKKARRIVFQCEEKINKIEEFLLQYAHRRVLIFTADTEMALRVSRELLVFAIISETPKKMRDQALQCFADGRLTSLVACRVLNEGYDLPKADIAIIIGGSHGRGEHLQRMGRVLRPVEDKRALIIELICQETFETNQSRKRNNEK